MILFAAHSGLPAPFKSGGTILMGQTRDTDKAGLAAQFGAALKLFHANRTAEAVRAFQNILAADARHVESLHYLGLIALRTGRLEDAIKLSQQAIEIMPEHASAHRTVADAFAIQGKLLEAEKYYNRTLALQPDDPVSAMAARLPFVISAIFHSNSARPA